MIASTKDRIEDIGQVFRWITPILIALVAYLGAGRLESIEAHQLRQTEKTEELSGEVAGLKGIISDVSRHENQILRLDERLREVELNGSR